MMQLTLQQIDQDLIQLLGKRIAVLTESASAGLEDGSPQLEQLLAHAGVPEFVWQNLAMGCAAALVTRSPAPTFPRQVTLIGGNGRMGRFFTQQLCAAGHHVCILGNEDWGQAEQLLGEADLVLICVPIESTIEIIQRTTPYLSPTTALADIASIKAPIIKAMLEHHPGPVMGLHPMFGPSVQSFLSQRVVVCSGREDQQFQWFLNLMEHQGAKLIASTPEEHDQMMVMVQAIRQFSTFGLGVFLSEEQTNLDRSLEFSSPSYHQIIEMINRLFAQAAPLVIDIMLATPERREAIARLANTYSRLAQFVVQEDQKSLLLEFEAAHSFFANGPILS